jgi:hypothetical protein
MAKAVHSMGGRICTYMLLWVPLQDLVVRPWGTSLHERDSTSHGGVHHVGLEAAFELKAHVEAKFHIYYFVLRS